MSKSHSQESMPLDQIVELLAKQTPDRLAELVQREGVKGRIATTTCCPLARALHEIYGGKFIVGREKIMRQSSSSLQVCTTPKNVAEFVHRFDNYQYPQLIDPPPRVTGKGISKKIGMGKRTVALLHKPRAKGKDRLSQQAHR